MSADAVRSVRNNNALNIERGDPWQGLMDREDMNEAQKAETRFCVFKSPAWGFRAAARTLITYYDKHKRDTVGKVVSRWAPEEDNNDTKAYIATVCLKTGFTRGQELDLHSYDHLFPLIKAMAFVEGGGWHFTDKDLNEGLMLAGVQVPPKSLAKSRTVQGTIAAGTVATVTEAVEQLEPALGIWSTIASITPWVGSALLIGLLGYILYARIDDRRRAVR